ncbi:hypothetical protein [Providencia rettgeri]|uniref:hypothetical protein n=1 Tax=Providencia rettgeri TaxID=587 RepID=UPI0034E08A22
MQASEDAFKKDVFEFQRDTELLLHEIKSWFDGSSIIVKLKSTRIYTDGVGIEVSSLHLSNIKKTLEIIPEGLYYFGIKGCLNVSIFNPDSSLKSSKFSLHWKDGVSKFNGWTIAYEVDKNSTQRIEFNQENFFGMIGLFA